MVDVIDNGQDEVYTTWYECMNCGCEDIMTGFNYCPQCGRKITRFLDRCNQEVNLEDKDFAKCTLPRGHTTPHRGVNFSEDEICWTDEEVSDWQSTDEYEASQGTANDDTEDSE